MLNSPGVLSQGYANLTGDFLTKKSTHGFLFTPCTLFFKFLLVIQTVLKDSSLAHL